jgi:hypothetical protein
MARMKRRIPSKPLTDAIARKGGLAEVLTAAGVEIYKPSDDPEVRDLNLTYKRYQRNIDRSAERGWFDLFWVDEFIVEIFGTHPVSVYSDWYELGDDEKLQEALAMPVPEAVEAVAA